MKRQSPLPGKITLLLTILLSSTVSHAQSLEATLDWSNRTELSSAVSGIIKKVNVVAGQQVKKDEILTQLSQPFYMAQFKQARAEQTSKKEELAEARRELDRALDLYERTVLAEHELQLAKNNHKKALSVYRKSQTGFVKARNDLGFSTIKAPFDAVVLKVLRKKNENVNARIEMPLMVIVAEAGKMIARAGINASTLGDVKIGNTVKVRVGGQSYSGKVISIGLEFIKGTEQYPMEVEFETGATQLRAGMKATIQL